MLLDRLKKYSVVLASQSPRRQQLLSDMGITFKVIVPDVDESFPDEMDSALVAEYISGLKAAAFINNAEIDKSTITITSDTVVLVGSTILGKPKGRDDAVRMLRLLSGREHQVITGVTLIFNGKSVSFSDKTNVIFRKLEEDEITYYIDTYRPFDKAGAYGIQEWIGYIGIERIEGSYFNVMGLPVERLYRELSNEIDSYEEI